VSRQEEVEKPWGAYQVLDAGEGFQVKRIEVRPGGRLSYQRHARRAEHWFVVAGEAQMILDGAERRLSPGEFVDIPVGAAHRLASAGEERLVLIEIQTGDYLGEDDIVRLEDDYGRVEA
jgi:mannose-6-phosphate isomerase